MRTIVLCPELCILSLFLALPLAGQVSILTHHGDNARTGANLNEASLTVSKVNKEHFGKLAYRLVNGNVYAQPRIVSQAKAVKRPNPTNLAIIATEHNSVYAFDAEDTNQNSATAKIWQTGPDVLGTHIDSYSLYKDIGIAQCVDITLEIGIMTPRIKELNKFLSIASRCGCHRCPQSPCKYSSLPQSRR